MQTDPENKSALLNLTFSCNKQQVRKQWAGTQKQASWFWPGAPPGLYLFFRPFRLITGLYNPEITALLTDCKLIFQ
jgi:hypothetical protein